MRPDGDSTTGVVSHRHANGILHIKQIAGGGVTEKCLLGLIKLCGENSVSDFPEIGSKSTRL